MILVFCCGKYSFLGRLKLMFFKILKLTATLLICNRVQASNFNNKAATWLHERIKVEMEKIK